MRFLNEVTKLKPYQKPFKLHLSSFIIIKWKSAKFLMAIYIFFFNFELAIVEQVSSNRSSTAYVSTNIHKKQIKTFGMSQHIKLTEQKTFKPIIHNGKGSAAWHSHNSNSIVIKEYIYVYA